MHLFVLALLFLRTLGGPPPSAIASNGDDANGNWDWPIARTQQGVAHGVHVNDAVSAFRGIPFAEPPVGDLRFRPPIPLPNKGSNCDDVIDASKFGPVCNQFHYKTVMLNNTIETTPQSEDCLTLNIFVPRSGKDGETLPILVWQYGGAFTEGGGSMPLFDPTNLVASQQNMIVVTLNYRLNLFGFPNSPAMQEQNLGIRDMRAALEWVRDNIGGFGGDPKKITLGGESSGADGASALMYWHKEDPIARALLLESGYPALAISENPHEEWHRITGIVGCRNKENSTAELECVRKKPVEDLKEAISNNTLNTFGTPFGGNPMVDNLTLFTAEEYARRGEAGDFARLPMLTGNNANEADSLLNWTPECGVNRTLSNAITVSGMQCPISLEASYRYKHSIPIWRYRYDGIWPAVTFFDWLRSYHGAEVAMLLGSYKDLSPHRPLIANEMAAAYLLQRAVSAFVHDPKDGLTTKMGWPKYNPNGETLIGLFSNNSLGCEFKSAGVYDSVCKKPVPIDWQAITAPAPPCPKENGA